LIAAGKKSACLDGDYFCCMIQTPFHSSAGGST
jgi:hypothetical protein